MENTQQPVTQEDIPKPTETGEGGEPTLLGSIGRFGLELVEIVVISLAIILPIRYFLIQPFYVKGASMEPAFDDHEYLIIDELSYRFRRPSRGEVVVFRYPLDPRQYFIKRVVGLPSETVRVSDSKIIITNAEHPDGFTLNESVYLSPDVITFGDRAVTLGADEYFVMGDNRTASLDSRTFGTLPAKNIVGRVWIRGWPIGRAAVFSAP